MRIEVFEAEEYGRWIVEGINEEGDGEVFWAAFYGWNAQERAKEHASHLVSKWADRQAPGQCNTSRELTSQ